LDNAIYDIWLSCVKGLGLKGQLSMLRDYGCSRNIYESGPKEYHRDLTGPKRIFDECVRNGIRIMALGQAGYPKRLAEIDDPPILLYCKGKVEINIEDIVAVVGARKATPYGKWAAARLGERLALHGVAVASGMAYGIDSSAHRGALSSGGKTIAVLGCGIDICYPQSNRLMMEEIMETGAVVSEFTPGTPPHAYNFPRRNRIIIGMSKCLAVVEACVESGSLITAEYALEQGKDVYAVPGNICSPQSLGTNMLIKDGAIPLVRIDDILTAVNVTEKIQPAMPVFKLGRDEQAVLEALSYAAGSTADQLSVKLGKPVREIRAIVSILEIKGVVESCQGKIFIAK